MIKYRNNNLIFSEKFYFYCPYDYDFLINVFDENKIGIYISEAHSYHNHIYYDYVNVLQYENQILSFYSNMYNLTLPKIGWHEYYESIKAYFTMTEQGVSILTTTNGTCLYYLSTICLSKNITLIANEPLDFPIEEFIKFNNI